MPAYIYQVSGFPLTKKNMSAILDWKVLFYGSHFS